MTSQEIPNASSDQESSASFGETMDSSEEQASLSQGLSVAEVASSEEGQASLALEVSDNIEEAELRAKINSVFALPPEQEHSHPSKDVTTQTFSRRDFFKTAGAAIIGGVIGGSAVRDDRGTRVSTNEYLMERHNLSHEFKPRVSIETQQAIDEESRLLDQEILMRIKKRSVDIPFDDDVELQKMMAETAALKERHGEVNGQELDLVGVTHAPETLLFERARLEEKISKAGAVVLEGAPEIAGLRSEAAQTIIRGELVAAGKSAEDADAWVKRNIVNNPFDVFFHEMEQLAKKHQKPVIGADPYSGPDRHIELLREHFRDGDKLQRLEDLMHLGFMGALSAASLAGGVAMASYARDSKIKDFDPSHSPDEEKSGTDQSMSRRKFLTGVGGLAIAAALAPTTITTMLENKGSEPVDQELSPLLYDLIDYRNVSVARGIEELTKEEKFNGPVVVIYGSHHTDPMMQYLSSPALRDAKYELYAPFRSVKPPQAEEYVYDEGSSPRADGSHWQQVKKVQI